MAQYPSYALGSGLTGMAPNTQEYGLTNIKRTPNYSDIIRSQARNLPALYALRGDTARKERELTLAEQALGQNLALEKERLATTERLSQEEMALNERLARERLASDRELSEAESSQRERTAKEQMEAQREQLGTSNIINTASTGMSLGMGGMRVYDFVKGKMADEAAKQAVIRLGPEGYGGVGAMAASNVPAPSLVAQLGPEGYGLGGGAPAALTTVEAPSAAAAGSAAAPMAASEAGAASAGAGAAGASSAGAMPTTFAGWLGPASVVALPVMGYLGGAMDRAKTRKFYNSPEYKAYAAKVEGAHVDLVDKFRGMAPEQKEQFLAENFLKTEPGYELSDAMPGMPQGFSKQGFLAKLPGMVPAEEYLGIYNRYNTARDRYLQKERDSVLATGGQGAV